MNAETPEVAGVTAAGTPGHEPESLRIIPDDWLNPLPLHRIFARPGPIEVDVGCGKGRFLLARAAKHPEINLLGIERKLARLRKVDRKACRRKLYNIRLLRLDSSYAVRYLIPENSIQTYFIFFPDPWPKKRHYRHRIMDPDFIGALYRTLKEGGEVHFATDHMPYFEQVRELLQRHPGLEPISPYVPPDDEKTDFELLFTGRLPIGRFSVRKKLCPQ